MLDPNPIVRGLGFRKLRLANIKTEVFPHDLMCQVEELNRDFIRAIENNPIHQRTQQIAVLATKAGDPRQQESIDLHLDRCLDMLQRVNHGEIDIPGREPGYFNHWIRKVANRPEPEDVTAYIRVSSFEPDDLVTKNWYAGFYEQLSELVRLKKVRIRYIFLLRDVSLSPGAIAFLDRFKAFAQEIRVVDMKGYHVSPKLLRPSIVLFERQKAVFTFDRADNTVLFEASEWILKRDFERLSRQVDSIRMATTVYFRSDCS